MKPYYQDQWELEHLLRCKLSLKFSNPLLSSTKFKNCWSRLRMLPAMIRKINSHKVLNPIIIPNPIDVMNTAAIWQLSIELFPNQYMLQNQPSFSGFWMLRHPNPCIAVDCTLAFPIMVVCSDIGFHPTVATKLGARVNQTATKWAWFSSIISRLSNSNRVFINLVFAFIDSNHIISIS